PVGTRDRAYPAVGAARGRDHRHHPAAWREQQDQGAHRRRPVGGGDQAHPHGRVGELAVRLKTEPRTEPGDPLMEPLALPTEPRTQTGKGAARQLRMKGLAPAVFYGPGVPPVSLSVAPKALLKVMATPFRRNQLIQLEVEGKQQL